MLKMDISFFLVLTLYYLPVEPQVIVSNNTCLYPNGGNCYGVSLSPTGFGPNYGEPLYSIAVVPSSNLRNYDVDNICTTYMPIGNNRSVLIRSTVYKNGSNSIGMYIEQSSTGFPNVYRAEGLVDGTGCSTCVFNTYILAALEGSCSGVYAYYRCAIFGGCAGPFVYGGVAANRPPEVVSPDCYKQAIVEFNSQGQVFTDVCGVQLPNRLARQCVTRMHGVPTTGADTVASRDSLELS